MSRLSTDGSEVDAFGRFFVLATASSRAEVLRLGEISHVFALFRTGLFLRRFRRCYTALPSEGSRSGRWIALVSSKLLCSGQQWLQRTGAIK